MQLSMRARAIVSGRTFKSLRQHRNYRLYFFGQFLSLIGTWLQSAAMAWLVLQLTHSAVAVGFLAFAQFTPYILFGLFGGAIINQFQHRHTLQMTQIALAVLSRDHDDPYAVQFCAVVGGIFDSCLQGGSLIVNNPVRHLFSRWSGATSYRTRLRSTPA